MKRMSTVQKCALIAGVVALLASQGIADTKLDELISAKKYDDAITYINTSITPKDRTLAEWMQLADAYINTKNETRALATYIIAGRMNPKSGEPLAGAASIYYDQKNYEKAEQFGKNAFSLTPNAESAWQYARAAIKLGKPTEAKKALEKVIATEPGNVAANSSLGQIYYDEKAYGKASTLLEVAYKNGPSQKLAHQIALSYKNSGNTAKAKSYYDLAVKGSSKNYQAMVELADLSYKENDFTRAYTEYSRTNGKLKFSAQQQFQYARSAEKAQKAGAVELYRKAITLYGADKSEDALTARLIVAEHDYSEKAAKRAVDNYKFYLATKKGKSPASAQVWYHQAEMQLILKNSSGAIVSLENSIALDKKYVASYALLADLYAQKGDDAKSESTLEGLIKQNQTDPSVYLKLGDYKFSKKVYGAALTNYEKSNSLEESQVALRGIALSGAKLKQWIKVVPAAQKVLAKSGDLAVRKAYTEALVATSQFDAAKDQVVQVVKADPKNIAFLKVQLKISNALKDAKLGLSADSALIKLEPKNIESRKRFSTMLIAKERNAEAYPIVKELTKLEPKTSVHFRNAATLAVKTEKKSEAITFLEKFLVLRATDVKATIELGELYYDAKQFDKALAKYRKALSLNSQPEGFPYEHYADLVIKKGETEEVIKALTGLVETGKADAGSYTTLGMLHKNKKQYKKAIEMYEFSLTLNPTDISANIALGECQLALGDATMAIVSFEQAAMMSPDSSLPYMKLGDAYGKSGDKAKSMDNYRLFIDKGGKSSAIAYKVGMDAYTKKEYKLAAKALLSVKGTKAEDFQRQLKLSLSLFETERYSEAITWSRKVMKRNPKVATQKILLGNIAISYEKLNKPTQALKEYDLYVSTKKWKNRDVEYKRAFLREKSAPALAKKLYRQNIARYSTDMRNYLQLGLMLSSSSKAAELKESAKYLEKVLANAGSKDAKLLLLVAEAYGKANLPEKELVAYQKYSEVQPEDIDAYVRIGELQMERGRYNEAVISFETASTLAPKRADILVMSAQAFMYQNAYTKAIPVLKNARTLDPNNNDILKYLVDSYIQSNQKDEARKVLKGLVAEGDPKYLTLYAQFLLEDGEFKEANKIVDGMLEGYAEDTQALLLKGQIQRAEGDNNGAIENFKYAAALDPYFAEANFELAETYSKMSGAKKRFALRFYDKAVKINPEYGEAWYGKAVIAKLFKMDAEYNVAIKNALRLLPADPKVQAEAKKAGILK